MASYNQAQAQWGNALSEKCHGCNDTIGYARLEWAHKMNMKMSKSNPMDNDNHNDPFIVVKYCKTCSDKRKKAYINS